MLKQRSMKQKLIDTNNISRSKKKKQIKEYATEIHRFFAPQGLSYSIIGIPLDV